jgi:C1A family cysteine protease
MTDTLAKFVIQNIPTDLAQATEAFLKYKTHFGKTYNTSDEEQKASIILSNAASRVTKLNKESVEAGSDAEYELNYYADIHPREFKKTMLTCTPPNDSKKAMLNPNVRQSSPFTPIPERDWSTTLAVSPVRAQGTCGSCWAWTAAGALEGANFIQNGVSEPLSPESLLACTIGANVNGCAGGWPSAAFEFAKKGVPREKDYPYTSGERTVFDGRGTCLTDRLNNFVTVIEFAEIEPNNELKLKEAVAKQPVAVTVDASTLMEYKGGIIRSINGCATVNHAVLAVGYGTDANGTKFWKLKNSWGEGWGENGYFRIERTDSTNTKGTLCLTQFPSSFPTVARSSPNPVPKVPTAAPTPVPTPRPTPFPTATPTPVPIARPTLVPTPRPTPVPIARPTLVPTPRPTPVPTAAPTLVVIEVPTPMCTPVRTELHTPVKTLIPFHFGVYTCSAVIGVDSAVGN